METSHRTRTTITTRVDSPVPRRRSKKKTKDAGIGMALIIALVLGWLVLRSNQRPVVQHPVVVKSGGR